MVQTGSYIEHGTRLDDYRQAERPRGLRVLSAFEDLYDMLDGFKGIRKDLDAEALREGHFRIYFHSVSPPGGKWKESQRGMRDYKVIIEAENFPARIDLACIGYRGSYEGLGLEIEDDIMRLKSSGIKNIDFLGYKGDVWD
jgi:hypothetical protein